MQTKKIIITGGPGTGKSSIIKHLIVEGYTCFPEISREIILEAQQKGIEQLFLEDPLLFSNMLLEARVNQFKEAHNSNKKLVFLDRGIPDVLAYLEYAQTPHPPIFKNTSKNHPYDLVFLLPPWEEIYISDNERYENFEQAQKIHQSLVKTYTDLGYNTIEVPKERITKRAEFILENARQ